jgi:hypothetical protein
MNLLNSRDLMDMVMRLRESGEGPFKYIAELFDWDVDGVKNAFKDEEGTSLDKTWRKVRDAKAEDPNIANQILKGTKTKDFKIPETKTEPTPGAGGPVIKPIEEPTELTKIKEERLLPGGEIPTTTGPGPAPEKKEEGVAGLETALSPETKEPGAPVGEETPTL